MQQAEGMSKFMYGHPPTGSFPAKFSRKQRISTIFSSPDPDTFHTITTATNCIYTIVNGYKVNVLRDIKSRFKLIKHPTICIVKIVTIGVQTIHAMNQRFTSGIGFKAKGFVPVSMRLHLLGIKGLNLANGHFHRIHHFLTKRTVTRQKVDHPHSTRFANIQIKRVLCSSIDTIACLRVFEIERQAKMHIIRWLWRSVSDRWEAE